MFALLKYESDLRHASGSIRMHAPTPTTGLSPLRMEPFQSHDEAQRFLIQSAYAHFRTNGTWPTMRSLDLQHGSLLDPMDGLEMLCRRIGADRVSWGSVGSEHDRLALHALALADVAEAAEDVQSFLAAVRLAASRYRDAGGAETRVTIRDLETDLHLDPQRAQRTLELLKLEPFCAGSGGDYVILGHLISKLNDVKTLEEYTGRQEAEQKRRQAVAQFGVNARPSSTAPVTRLFLSHAATDAPVAQFLAVALRRETDGLAIFVASRAGDIPAGDQWLPAITDELLQADVYLVLLTPVSITRRWLWFETGAAWWSEKRLLPVTAAGLEKHEVPFPLAALQVLKLDDPDEVMQLAKALGTTLTNPTDFCEAVRAIYRTLPQEPLTDESWEGVDLDGRFYAWDGPLFALTQRPDPVPASTALIERMRDAHVVPQFGLSTGLRDYRAQGFLPVYETDRRSWKREILSPGDGTQVLLIRPRGEGKG